MDRIHLPEHGGWVEVWNLPKIGSKKQHKFRYKPQSFEHPAKMEVGLCRKIIETFTNRGDLILDPMAGISTTQIEAALLGRNAIGVELEGKFVKLSKENIKLLEKLKLLNPKGKAVILKGDARKLSEILKEKADVAVFSPPYSENTTNKRDSDAKLRPNRSYRLCGIAGDTKGQIGNLKYGKPVDSIVFSPPFFTITEERGDKRAGENDIAAKMLRGDPQHKGCYLPFAKSKENIHKIQKYGEVDAIVTSPPFGDAEHHKNHGLRDLNREGFKGRKSWKNKEHIQKNYKKDNISRLKYGGKVDVIVTSPPYSETDVSQIHMVSKNRADPINPNYRPSWKQKIKEGYLETKRPYGKSSKQQIALLPHGEIDAIVTSPPFEKTLARENPKRRKGYWKGSGGYQSGHGTKGYGETEGNISNLPYGVANLSHGRVDAIVTSPPYLNAREGGGANKHPERFPTLRGVLKRKDGLKESKNPESIGNLPHGQVDAVVFSPPYVQTAGGLTGEHNIGAQLREGRATRASKRTFAQLKISKDSKNIDNLATTHYGQVDAIVTSPPYSEALTKRRGGYTMHKQLEKTRQYGGRADNIGNLPHGQVDVIVTSPPYELSMEGGSRHHPESEPHYRIVREKRAWNYYSDDKTGSQVGNLKGETYLSAMLRVYAECFKVVKDGGLMVLVLKNFIRNKKVQRLDLDTIKLCEAVGFRHIETKLFKLQKKSFWRILYERKHPDVDVSLLKFEFVEIFMKPMVGVAI